ncbi:MAG: hypothetical protein Kow0068_16640 [Marinilabiliales bacterium]
MKNCAKYLLVLIILTTGCNFNSDNKKNPEFLKMDFSYPRTLIYDFEQHQINIDNDFKDTTHTTTTCEIVLTSTLDTTGILVFRDLLVKSVNNHSTDTSRRTEESQAIENYNEFGEHSNKMLTHRFQSIFPLPYRNISDSSVFVFDVEMPINVYGPVIYVPGKCTFSIVDTLEYKNETCFKVKVLTNFKHVDKVSSIDGVYDCDIRYEFEGYLHSKEFYYIEGSGKVNSEISLSLPSNKQEKYAKKIMKSVEDFNYTLKTAVK